MWPVRFCYVAYGHIYKSGIYHKIYTIFYVFIYTAYCFLFLRAASEPPTMLCVALCHKKLLISCYYRTYGHSPLLHTSVKQTAWRDNYFTFFLSSKNFYFCGANRSSYWDKDYRRVWMIRKEQDGFLLTSQKLRRVNSYTAPAVWFLKRIKPLKTKRRPLYLKTQSVPRCKHFSSRL